MVPSTGGRAERWSEKKSLRESGFWRGWTCMSMRQAVVRVIAAMAPKTFNHEGHEGSRRKTHRAGFRGIPPLRRERARMGHPAKTFNHEGHEGSRRKPGRANAPVPRWTVPMPEFTGFRRRGIIWVAPRPSAG